MPHTPGMVAILLFTVIDYVFLPAEEHDKCPFSSKSGGTKLFKLGKEHCNFG